MIWKWVFAMTSTLRQGSQLIRKTLNLSQAQVLLNFSFWLAAGGIGILAVLYAKFIAWVQAVFFGQFESTPGLVTLAGPFLFVGATWLVRRFAPDAKGSGIPQVLSAIAQSAREPSNFNLSWQSSLVAPKTAVIKVLSSGVGILAGASIGREGPTVQIAAAGFSWMGSQVRRFVPTADFQTFLVAGSAAGVAAAFNTPIAGVAFAIEELGGGALSSVRQVVMLAVIVAGVISQAISGNYLYFGHPEIVNSEALLLMGESVGIGVLGGLAGGVFAKILAQPQLTKLPTHWIVRAFLTGAICALVGYLTLGRTAGSGYEVTLKILNSETIEDVSLLFPVLKLATTILSYLSGMAGGIFSPSLSIGAGLGLSVAKILGLVNFKACALIGMVAFFSGAVRAPLTGVIIVMEMTDQHFLILPFMIAAYLANSTGKLVMPEALYHYLARKHLDG